MPEELRPDQKWTLKEITVDSLELVLNTLRTTGKVYVEIPEGTLVPSLVGLLMKAQAEAVAFVNFKECTIRKMVPGEVI